MAEYAKFINAIDSFDSYSQKVIENCADFIQTATMVGSKIGDVIGKGAGFASSCVDDSNTKGVATKVGLSLVSTFAQGLGELAGGAIGEWRKNSKYKSAIKKIREDGLRWKMQCFELIPHSIELCRNRIADSNKEIEILKEDFFKTSLKEAEELEKAKQLRACIQHLYQAEYRLELAKKISFYFENFENQLEDLESFANWYEKSILVDKIECYKVCYEKIFDIMIENVDSEKWNYVENIFHIVDSMVPILVLSPLEKHNYKIDYELARIVIEVSKGKEVTTGYLPDSCYDADGIDKLIPIFTSCFNDYVIPKFRKFRNLFMTIPALILTSVYSILSLTNVFSFARIIKLSINKNLYIPIVFLFVEILCLIPVMIKKSKTFNYLNLWPKWNIYSGYEFVNNIYQICEEYAENEKNIDEKELKALEQESQQNYITQENGEKISEDDFLDSIINK